MQVVFSQVGGDEKLIMQLRGIKCREHTGHLSNLVISPSSELFLFFIEDLQDKSIKILVAKKPTPLGG